MGSPRPLAQLAIVCVIAASAALAGVGLSQRDPLADLQPPVVDLTQFEASTGVTTRSTDRTRQHAVQTTRLLVQTAPRVRMLGGRPIPGQRSLRTVTIDRASAAATRAEIGKLAGVELVEPDTIMRWTSDIGVNGAPTDPLASSAWSLDAMGWAATPRFQSTPLIAVLDSGLETTHPEFSGEISPGVPKIAATWNAMTGTSAVPDEFGHGTGTASVATALASNGIGVTGVAPRSQLMMVKVGGLDGVRVSDAIAGIDWATQNGAKVINMSFSTPERSLALRDAVFRAVARGVVVVAAVGNDGCAATGGGNELQYPAGFPHVIGVAASMPGGGIACFSNWGSEVDLAAPGTSIPIAVPDSQSNGTLRNPGGYRTANGTSFAAPAVAGAAALVLAAHPDWRPDQVRSALLGTARDLGARGVDARSGHGLVQIPAAVTLTNIAPADADEINDDITQARALRTVRGTARFAGMLDRSDDPSDVRAVRVGRSGSLVAKVKSGSRLRTEVLIWSGKARSTAVGGSTERRLVLARGARAARAKGLRPGSVVYVQVVSRRGASGYSISIAAR